MPPFADRIAPGAPLAEASRLAGIRDERLLAAIAATRRAPFVPRAVSCRADADEPLPIGDGQVTTQPSLVAHMLEALALRGGEKVLEVGTGHGYQTALLAQLAADVWSIELRTHLLASARRNLAAAGFGGVHLVSGDGTRGLPAQAPFDAIVVAAAFPEVPPPLAAQLALGGRLVQPIGPGGREDVTLFVRTRAGIARRAIVSHANFVRLHGRHGYPSNDPAG